MMVERETFFLATLTLTGTETIAVLYGGVGGEWWRKEREAFHKKKESDEPAPVGNCVKGFSACCLRN